MYVKSFLFVDAKNEIIDWNDFFRVFFKEEICLNFEI